MVQEITKPAFKTSDGEIFDTLEEAERHEKHIPEMVLEGLSPGDIKAGISYENKEIGDALIRAGQRATRARLAKVGTIRPRRRAADPAASQAPAAAPAAQNDEAPAAPARAAKRS